MGWTIVNIVVAAPLTFAIGVLVWTGHTPWRSGVAGWKGSELPSWLKYAGNKFFGLVFLFAGAAGFGQNVWALIHR